MEETSRLAKQLTAVSVREISGVRICRDQWGIDAEHVLDPTMLLSATDYLRIASDSLASTVPYLFDFTLDSGESNMSLAEAIADSRNLTIDRFLPRSPESYGAVKKSPSVYRKASIPDLLRGFADADFVVTDSFHGTVFSILFERPFVTVVNKSRGAARFESLLGQFGLTDRVVPERGYLEAVAASEIDWSQVREVLKTSRHQSLNFLREALLHA